MNGQDHKLKCPISVAKLQTKTYVILVTSQLLQCCKIRLPIHSLSWSINNNNVYCRRRCNTDYFFGANFYLKQHVVITWFVSALSLTDADGQ